VARVENKDAANHNKPNIFGVTKQSGLDLEKETSILRPRQSFFLDISLSMFFLIPPRTADLVRRNPQPVLDFTRQPV
jgi:hypothetical protein